MAREPDVGALIAAWLDFRKMSPKDLAEKCEVTVAAVYQWMGTGEKKTAPSWATLVKIVAAFDTTFDRFFAKKVA